MRKISSKSTFHAVWREIDKRLLEQWIILQGKEITSRREVKGLAADSSGFKNRQACLWRFLKWSKGGLKRTSRLFRKIHLIIALPSRAIVSLTHSHSNTHDSKVFGGLWQKLPSTLLRPTVRFYADSAYWSGQKISSGSLNNMVSILSFVLKVMLLSTILCSDL